jgi:hypothetical protein
LDLKAAGYPDMGCCSALLHIDSLRYVEHWEVEIELARIAMQLNCDNQQNIYGQSELRRVQLNDLNIPITHACFTSYG